MVTFWIYTFNVTVRGFCFSAPPQTHATQTTLSSQLQKGGGGRGERETEMPAYFTRSSAKRSRVSSPVSPEDPPAEDPSADNPPTDLACQVCMEMLTFPVLIKDPNAKSEYSICYHCAHNWWKQEEKACKAIDVDTVKGLYTRKAMGKWRECVKRDDEKELRVDEWRNKKLLAALLNSAKDHPMNTLEHGYTLELTPEKLVIGGQEKNHTTYGLKRVALRLEDKGKSILDLEYENQHAFQIVIASILGKRRHSYTPSSRGEGLFSTHEHFFQLLDTTYHVSADFLVDALLFTLFTMPDPRYVLSCMRSSASGSEGVASFLKTYTDKRGNVDPEVVVKFQRGLVCLTLETGRFDIFAGLSEIERLSTIMDESERQEIRRYTVHSGRFYGCLCRGGEYAEGAKRYVRYVIDEDLDWIYSDHLSLAARKKNVFFFREYLRECREQEREFRLTHKHCRVVKEMFMRRDAENWLEHWMNDSSLVREMADWDNLFRPFPCKSHAVTKLADFLTGTKAISNCLFFIQEHLRRGTYRGEACVVLMEYFVRTIDRDPYCSISVRKFVCDELPWLKATYQSLIHKINRSNIRYKGDRPAADPGTLGRRGGDETQTIGYNDMNEHNETNEVHMHLLQLCKNVEATDASTVEVYVSFWFFVIQMHMSQWIQTEKVLVVLSKSTLPFSVVEKELGYIGALYTWHRGPRGPGPFHSQEESDPRRGEIEYTFSDHPDDDEVESIRADDALPHLSCCKQLFKHMDIRDVLHCALREMQHPSSDLEVDKLETIEQLLKIVGKTSAKERDVLMSDLRDFRERERVTGDYTRQPRRVRNATEVVEGPRENDWRVYRGWTLQSSFATREEAERMQELNGLRQDLSI